MNILVSYIIVTFGRNKDLIECLEKITSNTVLKNYEIIVIDNKNEYIVRQIVENFVNTRYFASYVNLGVSGGRNFGIRQARGKYLVFIDDDAIFDTYAFDKILVEEFESSEKLGAICFKILNFSTRKPNIGELPFPRKYTKELINKKTFVSYFIGAGHAIRKEVFENAGIYPEDFVYGGEELYLSYNLLKKGYSIVYLPSIVVLHKKSPKRLGNKLQIYYEVRNKIIISMKFLPMPYLIINLAFTLIKFLYVSFRSKSLMNYFRGVSDGFKVGLKVNRSKIGKDEITYLKKYYGRLWY
ncbi:MAG: glycosyltransferase family 2 protein [Nitrososphaeria archaeon]